MNRFHFPHGLAVTAGLFVMTMSASVHAQVAVRDATTGAMRAPTAAEAAALAPGNTSKTKGAAPKVGMVTGTIDPQPVQYRDGTVGLELDASTMSFSVAKVNTDGSVSTACVTGEEAANKAVVGQASFRKKNVSTAKAQRYEEK